MRHVFGFMGVFALGLMLSVGCGEGTKCQTAADCDDQNECTDDSCVARRCENSAIEYQRCDFDGLDDILDGLDGACIEGVCEKNPCDDDNECTLDQPTGVDSCEHIGCDGCQPCDRNGEPGVCDGEVCAEYPCNDGALCDDGDLCTRGWCEAFPLHADYGMCKFFPRCVDSNVCTDDTCDPETGECSYPPADGKSCCVRWVGCGGICIPGPCDWCCERWGYCDQTGECR